MTTLGRPVRAASPRATSYESSGAWTVDRAVRALATACARRSRPVPAAGALVLGPDSVQLRLVTPDEAAPPGWSTEEQGRTWRFPLDLLPDAPIDPALPPPYPRLVSLGVTGDGRMLLNLAEADGLVSLEGDPARVGDLARTWAARLTTSPWSAGLQVIRAGFGDDPGERFTGLDVPDLAEVTGILDGPDGGVLVLAEAPQGRDLEYVTWLIGDTRRWSVVTIEAADARWRLRVDSAGTVQTGLLDGTARLRA